MKNNEDVVLVTHSHGHVWRRFVRIFSVYDVRAENRTQPSENHISLVFERRYDPGFRKDVVLCSEYVENSNDLVQLSTTTIYKEDSTLILFPSSICCGIFICHLLRLARSFSIFLAQFVEHPLSEFLGYSAQAAGWASVFKKPIISCDIWGVFMLANGQLVVVMGGLRF